MNKDIFRPKCQSVECIQNGLLVYKYNGESFFFCLTHIQEAGEIIKHPERLKKSIDYNKKD